MESEKPSKPDISVIVPVYNVGPYLTECLDSLFSQSYNNIEFIFIDDCSSDGSREILERKIADQSSDHNIKVILHTENKGISYTRQEGVLLAEGRWVVHCDSDDIVEPRAYEMMIEEGEAASADIVICSFDEFGERIGRLKRIQGKGELSSQDMIKSLAGVSNKKLHGGLCNKLIRRELFKDISFPENISYCEDLIVLLQLLIKNPEAKIIVSPDILYHYRVRENSLVRKRSRNREKELQRLIELLEEIKKDTYDVSGQILPAIDSKIITLLYRALSETGNIREFGIRYKKYQCKLPLNNELNRFEKLHLEQALKSNVKRSKLIGFGNKYGRESIKRMRSFIKN